MENIHIHRIHLHHKVDLLSHTFEFFDPLNCDLLSIFSSCSKKSTIMDDLNLIFLILMNRHHDPRVGVDLVQRFGRDLNQVVLLFFRGFEEVCPGKT